MDQAPDMRLSPSAAKILIQRTPWHAWSYHRLGGGLRSADTTATVRGRLLDRMLFGVGPEIVVIDADDFRTKAAKQTRDDALAAGKVPILRDDIEGKQRIIDAWRVQLAEKGIRLDGESQKKIDWFTDGCPCRGYLDHFIAGTGVAVFYDLKTCEDASADAARRALVHNGGDIQHAAYTEAIEVTHPRYAGAVRGLFIFAEVEPPYAIHLIEPSGSMRALGKAKWDRAKRVWAECLESNQWPGYRFSTSVDAMPWELAQAFPEGIPDELAATI